MAKCEDCAMTVGAETYADHGYGTYARYRCRECGDLVCYFCLTGAPNPLEPAWVPLAHECGCSGGLDVAGVHT